MEYRQFTTGHAKKGLGNPGYHTAGAAATAALKSLSLLPGPRGLNTRISFGSNSNTRPRSQHRQIGQQTKYKLGVKLDR